MAAAESQKAPESQKGVLQTFGWAVVVVLNLMQIWNLAVTNPQLPFYQEPPPREVINRLNVDIDMDNRFIVKPTGEVTDTVASDSVSETISEERTE